MDKNMNTHDSQVFGNLALRREILLPSNPLPAYKHPTQVMKPARRYTRFVVFIFTLIHAVTASATTFTTDTYIGPNDSSSDGQDIIVTNCTLTVDGAHGFNSLQILNGGVLTHSAFTNGPQQFTNSVSDENQVLSTTNPATLNKINVNTNTIMVMDSTATIIYTPNVDYLVTVTNQFAEQFT